MTKPTLHRFARLVTIAGMLAASSAMAAPAAPASLEPAVRLKLARSAADKAGLHEVGLDFRDVYGVISAESSWVPRTGLGRNGVVSEGLGQFEPATARAVGLKDPNDAVEAVHAAARLLREAAVWSAQRIERLGLGPDQRAAKLREGISIYYNLSTRARSTWSGLNTASLPAETLRHIHNVREGARQADQLNARLGGPNMPPLPHGPVVAARAQDRAAVVRTATAVTAAPQALGTIEWSGKGGEGPGAGRRSYVVFSNGSVRPQSPGDVPTGAIRFTQHRGG
jgi:hypothetical protein